MAYWRRKKPVLSEIKHTPKFEEWHVWFCTTPPSPAARDDVHCVQHGATRQGGTAGCGTPGHNKKASLPFLLHNTSAELTQTVQRVRIQAQGGGFCPQHTGLVQQGSAAAPPARSQPQVLLGPAKPGREWFQLLEEQLLLQKTWMKPIPSPRATWTEQRAGLQAHGTAVLCYSRTGLSLCQEQLLTCAQTWAQTEHHILPLSPLALLQVGTLYWKFRMLPVILTLCSTLCL